MSTNKATFLDAATFSCDLVKPSCVDEWTIHSTTAPEQTAERIADCDLIFTNKVRIGAEELEAAPNLKLIVVAATGYDTIDLDACRKKNVAVANSPGYSSSSVPEHALALMFAVGRSIVALHGAAKSGTWTNSPIFCVLDQPIMELRNKTVGIVGAGNLGKATGKLCEAIGMKPIYYDTSKSESEGNVHVSFEELLATSDIVSLHCQLDTDSLNMMNEKRFGMMQKHSILINTARGGLVEAQALVDALDASKIAGAGIDVLDKEPPVAEHPLLTCKHPGLVVTPHVAWASQESQTRLANMIASTADSFFDGNPQHTVT